MTVDKVIQCVQCQYSDGKNYACDVNSASDPFGIVQSLHLNFTGGKRQKKSTNLREKRKNGGRSSAGWAESLIQSKAEHSVF